ncbi:SAM-dependent methyltransferase, partial [Nocardia sp. CNY236]|uniref:SAM-dependent methyltransferase n=1 Tax=Nocardia sp. CNY236 TaxID=1169152 RepID=UPI00048AC842
IVAAGLDARAYRLDWPADTAVFEIDQSKVLEFKQVVLTEHHAQPTCDRRPVTVDLREDWPAALRSAGFDPEKPAAWSAEGLLPYLPGTAQDLLFARIDELSAPGSQLGLEVFMASGDFKSISDYEKQMTGQSPFGGVDPDELFYDDERADPAVWLADKGWVVHPFSLEGLTLSYGRAIPEMPDELGRMMKQPRYLTATR